MTLNLKQFAAKHPGGPHNKGHCQVCVLSDVQEIDRGLKEGLPATLISAALLEQCGIKINATAIRRHRGHI